MSSPRRFEDAAGMQRVWRPPGGCTSSLGCRTVSARSNASAASRSVDVGAAELAEDAHAGRHEQAPAAAATGVADHGRTGRSHRARNPSSVVVLVRVVADVVVVVLPELAAVRTVARGGCAERERHPGAE